MQPDVSANKPRLNAKIIVKLVLIVAVALGIGAAAIWLGSHRSYPPKERIEELALKAAKDHCHTESRIGQAECDTLKIVKTEGPRHYASADIRDKYSGNWFVTVKSNPNAQTFLFVATNFDGNVQYINTSGKEEFPVCKDDCGARVER